MSVSPPARRRYDATARRAGAARTREAVFQAAFDLFSTRGYRTTRLADIAEAAGVSVETVQKIGPKHELLEAAARRPVLAQGTPDDPLAMPFVARALTRPDPREALDELAVGYADMNRAVAGLWRTWAGAAVDDPALAALWRGRMAQVRNAMERALRALADRGWVRADVEAGELAATLWLLTMAETYERMTVHAGLDHAAYTAWLSRSLADLLLPRRPLND